MKFIYNHIYKAVYNVYLCYTNIIYISMHVYVLNEDVHMHQRT